MDNPDTRKIWNETLESIKITVSGAIFSTWFTQTHLSSLTKKGDRYNAEIGCSSSYVRATIESRYYGLVQDSLAKSLSASCDISFTVKADPNQKPPEKKSKSETDSPLFNNETDENVLNERLKNAHIRPGFTFENFAVSGSNQMAWAAAEAVADNPGQAYNPLFIWGGVGVGKTHLMNAIGYRLSEKTADTKLIFCTGEQFTNDIVEGIKNKSTQKFRNKYRRVDALFIDDIQFIAGKDAVQEEFFHTFNAIVASGGQIVLNSDRPPSEIAKLEERLRSRFEAGLIVDISPPDFELRCAIIMIKAEEKGINLNEDLVRLTAGNIQTARQIEGFLVRLTSEARLKGVNIDEDLIKSMFVSNGEVEVPKKIKTTPQEIINAVSKHYSIGKRALLGKSRAKPVSFPRQILMYLLRIDLGLPLQEVGRIVGGRDHTTVMHAVDKVTDLAKDDVEIRQDIRGIKNML